MRGLLLKDILVMRKAMRTYVIMLAFYVALSVMGMFHVSMCISMGVLVVMMSAISPFAYDEAARWDCYAAALPTGRLTPVRARYLFVLVLTVAVTAYSLVLAVLFSVTGRGPLSESLGAMAGGIGVALLIVSVMLPLCYKLGPERARPFLFAVILAPLLLGFAAYKLGLAEDLLQAMENLGAFKLLGGVAAAALAGIGLSYLLSCRIYAKKEF